MKIKTLTGVLTFMICMAGALIPGMAGDIPEIILQEKRKQLSYSFSISQNDRINIDNQFGDVRVKFWNKNMVKVDIAVIANAPQESQAGSFLNLVSVVNNKENGNVTFKTVISPSFSRIKNSQMSKDKNRETNLRVDYVVFMPQDNELNLSNSFGDVYLPEFSSVLNLKQNYGTLFAESISNALSKVSINFGKANIKSMHGGDLLSNYTVLNIDDCSKIVLKNNNGSLKIGQVADIMGVLNYSEGVIGNIKDAVKLRLNYSDDLKINKIDDKVKDFELKGNYSSINLPFGENFNADFDIKVNYADLKINEDKVVRFTRNTEQEARKAGKAANPVSNSYSGRIGNKNSDAKIIIISNHGNVQIK